MSVQAKFRLHYVQRSQNADSSLPDTSRTLHFSAVYSSDPASENYSWSTATPGANLSMTVTNPAAFEQFEQGAEYILTFNKV